MATLGEYIPTSNTKLLLHLNGNSTDSSGNGNNGTDTAITYVDGKFGKCASFSTSKIDFANTTPSNTALTISLWFNKTYKPSGNGGRLFFLRNGGGAEYQIVQGSGNEIIDFNVAGVGSVNTTASSGVWHNFVCVINGTTTSIYLNGKLVNSASGTATNMGSSTTRIGQGFDNSYNYTGKLDEIIYEPNRAWSAQEVAKYYTYAKGYYATL